MGDDASGWLSQCEDVLVTVILILHYFVHVLQVQRLTHGIIFGRSLCMWFLLCCTTDSLTYCFHLNLMWLIVVAVLIWIGFNIVVVPYVLQRQILLWRTVHHLKGLIIAQYFLLPHDLGPLGQHFKSASVSRTPLEAFMKNMKIHTFRLIPFFLNPWLQIMLLLSHLRHVLLVIVFR